MLNRNKITKLKALIVGLTAVLFAASVSAAGSLDSSLAIEKQVVVSAHKSQLKIDRFAEQTMEMEADYKSTLRVIESLKIYNNQLEALIASQEAEMLSIEGEIATIDETERGVVPLMNEMIASLERFIQLDLPFTREARLDRVNRLKNNMLRADVPTAEKYRTILAAYEDEIKYGDSFATYQDEIQTADGAQKVEFLRFGRILLVYLTLDGASAGYWNADANRFEPLGSEYIRSLEQGIKIANKQASNNLIKLPVAAAKEAQ